MKRMIDEKLIEIVKNLSAEDVEFLKQFVNLFTYSEEDGLYLGSKFEIEGDLMLDQGIAGILDGNDDTIFPLENNAGKVLAVNEDEDGLEAKDLFAGFTHSFNDLDDTLKTICESAVINTASCSATQWTAIQNLLNQSLYFYYTGYTMIKMGGYYPFAYVFSSLTGDNGGRLEFNYNAEDEELSILFTEA